MDGNDLAVALNPKLASCQGEEGACPAAPTGQDVDLRAWNSGREAAHAVKIVLGETGRRREREDEATRHDMVPTSLSQICVIFYRIFNL